jgi:RHS repeat-associated protein
MPAPGSVIHLSFEDCGPGYLITDGANNVRASAETGSLHTDLIRCDAYGQTGPGIEQSFLPVPGFRGSLYLPKAELYDMGHRTYSAPAGRFFSPDPAREGINWYAYAGGDPVNFFDPFGLTVMGIIEGMRQQDKRWKDCQLGTEDTTIGKEGCKLTGITNIANAIIGKVEETPKSLNDLAVENDIYCGGGGALSTEGSKQLVNKAVDEITIAVERVETDGDKIYSKICELDNDTSVEVYIHVKIKTSALNDATNTYVHWVNIVDVDENGNLVVFDTSVRNRLTVEPAKLLAAEIFTAEKVK